MNTFESNLSVMESRQPRLAYGIREAGGGALTVTSARNGLPTAQHNTRWIHSAYDPMRKTES